MCSETTTLLDRTGTVSTQYRTFSKNQVVKVLLGGSFPGGEALLPGGEGE